MQKLRPQNPSMTFDEVSMERSMDFVKALQELKNIRPQLYSAAEYCEKSYLHSEQKQMVLENLKDYAVRAIVKVVDHLGTVAYKLTDLFEQKTVDVATMELNISCLSQQLLTCETYTDEEGLRQQQLFTVFPRHHKRYTLPNSVNKKVHFSPYVQIDARQKLFQARPHINPSALGTPASKPLSWHLASETKSNLNGIQRASPGSKDPKVSGTISGVFHLFDSEEVVQSNFSYVHPQPASRSPASSAVMQTFGFTRRAISKSTTKTTQTKDQALQVFIQYKSLVENQFNIKIKTLQSNNGGEFKVFARYLHSYGIAHRFSCPYTSAQNGKVERKHRHVMETGFFGGIKTINNIQVL